MTDKSLVERIIPEFDVFWQVYPRKEAKKKAEIAFNKLSNEKKRACIAGTIFHIANNPQWKNPQFIPMPTTFINGELWNNEITIPEDAKDRIIGFKNGSEAHDVVWSAMTQFFGTSWINKHGESPPELWRKLLKGISEKRILRGMKRCMDDHKDHPPSLPKFMEYTAKTFDEVYPTALPKPLGDPVKALASLQEMKEILGVK